MSSIEWYTRLGCNFKLIFFDQRRPGRKIRLSDPVGFTMENCRILLYPMGIRLFLSESLVQESNRKL